MKAENKFQALDYVSNLKSSKSINPESINETCSSDVCNEFDMVNNCKLEKALRHRYDIVTHKWIMDTVYIKMEEMAFAEGSLRVCYRMKMLPSDPKISEWKHAQNFVAKQFKKPTSKSSYTADIYIQMMAKHWGECYNSMNPPKSVYMIETAMLEILDRDEKCYYNIEKFIPGEYIKYNSNSGFVECEVNRQTPQSFSHFTFEKSDYDEIVVDIQGVGDFYTDPQIHCTSEKYQSEGNLGIKGHTLFFSTHICSSLCHYFKLMPFSLSKYEHFAQIKNNKRRLHLSKTIANESYEVETEDESNDDYYSFNISFDILISEKKKSLGPRIAGAFSMIHYQMALYHSINYFKYDLNEAPNCCLFHLIKAAYLNHSDALLYLSRWISGSSDRDEFLKKASPEQMGIKYNKDTAYNLLKKAADLENINACLELSELYDPLTNTTQPDFINYGKAAECYEKFLELQSNQSSEFMTPYKQAEIYGKVGEIYEHEGNLDLASKWIDQAAKFCIQYGLGKLAMSYFERLENLG